MTYDEFMADWRSDNPRLKVQTSGSTGKPQVMWVEKRRMLASATMTCDFLHLKRGDGMLLCLPLDYIAGKMVVARTIERGLRLTTIVPSGHPYQTLAESGNLSHFACASLVPLQVYNSLQTPKEREWLASIDNILVGGGSISRDVEAQLRGFPNAIWSTYGMTETLSHIAMRRVSGPEASLWYTPLPHVSVSLTDEGCLVIDAPLVHEGRLVTNDLAELRPAPTADAKGVQFRILGRRDNVICSGGIKIQTEEVERLLEPHLHSPFVITHRPDEKFGEAVVLLTEDADLDAVRAVCQEVLPAYSVPKDVFHVAHVPMTETGKPARKQAEILAASLTQHK